MVALVGGRLGGLVWVWRFEEVSLVGCDPGGLVVALVGGGLATFGSGGAGLLVRGSSGLAVALVLGGSTGVTGAGGLMLVEFGFGVRRRWLVYFSRLWYFWAMVEAASKISGDDDERRALCSRSVDREHIISSSCAEMESRNLSMAEFKSAILLDVVSLATSVLSEILPHAISGKSAFAMRSERKDLLTRRSDFNRLVLTSRIFGISFGWYLWCTLCAFPTEDRVLLTCAMMCIRQQILCFGSQRFDYLLVFIRGDNEHEAEDSYIYTNMVQKEASSRSFKLVIYQVKHARSSNKVHMKASDMREMTSWIQSICR